MVPVGRFAVETVRQRPESFEFARLCCELRIDTSLADERYSPGWLDSPGPEPAFEWDPEALSGRGSPE